jgi:glycosyltransferase involved in cell wall biosynthesis
VNTARRRLVFVSPRFLFPTDSGGRIRTTQVLRGMKGGAFHITLVMPATADARQRFAAQIDSVCDAMIAWESRRPAGFAATAQKALAVLSRYPVPVAVDRDPQGARAVADALGGAPDVVVFDFPHAAVLAPPRLDPPSVMFTHNVEAEIFRRHAEVATGPRRILWQNQYEKMCRFERGVLTDFDTVVAVSDRDAAFFRDSWQVGHCRAIPTGVDTDFFDWQVPGEAPQVVFCGSMDWLANVDAVEFFHDEVWPQIRARRPDARMKVIGRNPPAGLVRRIGAVSADWEFTGFVDDVRDHVQGAAAFVIPLRVGGGTRIKAFEAMAMGAPVVSTAIGIEGLSLTDGDHFLEGNTPDALAGAVVRLLDDGDLRHRLSGAARELVEQTYGFRRAAAVFEEICLETMTRCAPPAGRAAAPD